LVSILGGQETIRDFIAFPKNNSGRDVMIDSPATIDDEQLKELNIKLENMALHHMEVLLLDWID